MDLSVFAPGSTDPAENSCKSWKMDQHSSQSQNQCIHHNNIFIGKDRTRWEELSSNDPQVGRLGQHNILNDIPGSTSLPKHQIVEGSAMSAFCLFVDRFMIDHIQQCTEIDARAKTGDDNWNISTVEIYALLAIMHARGLLAKGQPVEFIWSKIWDLHSFVTLCLVIDTEKY